MNQQVKALSAIGTALAICRRVRLHGNGAGTPQAKGGIVNELA
jgi:hypothetical protein